MVRPGIAIMLVSVLMPHAACAAICHDVAVRNLQGGLAGTRSVRVDLHGYQLHLKRGAESGFILAGQACASDRATLKSLTITQRRSGDQLVLELGTVEQAVSGRLGRPDAHLDVTMQLPASMPVLLEIGSGVADVSGMQHVQAQVGSGNLQARNIGSLSARVGSGVVVARDIGELEAGAVGSGKLTATRVRGDVRLGHVGSGVVQLRRIGGSVRVEAIASGTLEVNSVDGNFSLGAKGAGKVILADVKGALSVPQD